MSRTLLEFVLLSALSVPRSAPSAAEEASRILGTPILRQVAATAIARLVEEGLAAMEVKPVGKKRVNIYERTPAGELGLAEIEQIVERMGIVGRSALVLQPETLASAPASLAPAAPCRVLHNFCVTLHGAITAELTEALNRIRDEDSPTMSLKTYEIIDEDATSVLYIGRNLNPADVTHSIWMKPDHTVPGEKRKGPAMMLLVGDDAHQNQQAKLLFEAGWRQTPPK